jgi:uncharacterized protein YndB with AHSA1/START domain
VEQKVERRVELHAAPATVWRALTQGPELSSWFGARVDLEPRLGGRAVFTWPDGRARDATVEVFDPERQLVLRWLPFERDADGATRVMAPGYIRFLLDAVGDGSVLSVSESLAEGTEPSTSKVLSRTRAS